MNCGSYGVDSKRSMYRSTKYEQFCETVLDRELIGWQHTMTDCRFRVTKPTFHTSGGTRGERYLSTFNIQLDHLCNSTSGQYSDPCAVPGDLKIVSVVR